MLCTIFKCVFAIFEIIYEYLIRCFNLTCCGLQSGSGSFKAVKRKWASLPELFCYHVCCHCILISFSYVPFYNSKRTHANVHMQLHPYLIPLSFLIFLHVSLCSNWTPPPDLGTQSLSFLQVLANYMDKLKLKLICIDFVVSIFFMWTMKKWVL